MGRLSALTLPDVEGKPVKNCLPQSTQRKSFYQLSLCTLWPLWLESFFQITTNISTQMDDHTEVVRHCVLPWLRTLVNNQVQATAEVTSSRKRYFLHSGLVSAIWIIAARSRP